MKKLSFILILLLSFISIVCGNFTISPLKFEYSLDPGKSEIGKIIVTNNGEDDITLYTSKEDFIAGDDTGTPKFLKPGDDLYGIYGLSSWIDLSEEHLTLSAGEKREITFKVTAPQTSEPGGHYGAIFFSPGAGEGGQVSIVQRLGVLILVEVSGEVRIEGNLESFKVGLIDDNSKEFVEKSNFNLLPINFPIRFLNSGNVHLKPMGKILIYDDQGNQLEGIGEERLINANGVMLGTQIVNYIPVNEIGSNVLPGQTRRFDINWEGFGYKILNEDGTRGVKFKSFQNYMDEKADKIKNVLNFWESIKEVKVNKKFKAVLNLSYEGKDGQKKDFNQEKEFWINYNETQIVINWFVVGGIISLLIIIVIFFIYTNKGSKEKIRQQLLKEMEYTRQIPIKKNKSIINNNKKNEDEINAQNLENIPDNEDSYIDKNQKGIIEKSS